MCQKIKTLLAAVMLGLMSKYNFKLSIVSSFVNNCLSGGKDKKSLFDLICA